MILQSLVDYYDALAAKGEIAKPGWTTAKVSFALNIGEDGRLVNILPLKGTDTSGKKSKPQPMPMSVPEQLIRTGLTPKANFMCDNSSYFLGIDNKGNPERAKQCFEAAASLHAEILREAKSPAAEAVKAYFRNWDPDGALSDEKLAPYLKELQAGGNLVFMFRGAYVHEDPEVSAAWERYRAQSSNSRVMQCLVTGRRGPVARLHPTIKGVRGAQPSGASLVSFNATAYESYGKVDGQGLNAPVSEEAAHAYGAALNKLLADRDHVRTVGDTTVVFWALDAEGAYQDLFCAYTFGDFSSEGGRKITDKDLEDLVGGILSGRAVNWESAQLKYDNQFFVLGLSPNAARLSVRFFLKGSFGDFLKNLKDHHDRLEIVRPPYDTREHLTVERLLWETVNKNSREKAPLPALAGETLRAILTGGRYPSSLFSGVMLRVRADREINRVRAAIIKAYLLRNFGGKPPYSEVLKVALNENSRVVPYLLGREFAVLEWVQGRANPDISSTIKDKYFTSACATPSTVFPLLEKLAQHHLRKLTKRDKTYFDKLIGEIKDKLEVETSGENSPIPSRLTLEEQGVFILGYYHQRQKLFDKSDKNEEE